MAYVSKIKVGSDTLLVGSNLYGECSTAADVAAKVVNISGFSQLSSGVTIHVKFDNTNKALSPTLNVSSTGAKPIYRQGKITPSVSISSSWADGAIVSLTYNTSNISTGCWVMNDVNIDPSEDVSYITNLTPYLLRPTCDGLIRGSGYNRETDEIVGGTLAWNQLVPTASKSGSVTPNGTYTYSIDNILVALLKDHRYVVSAKITYSGSKSSLRMYCCPNATTTYGISTQDITANSTAYAIWIMKPDADNARISIGLSNILTSDKLTAEDAWSYDDLCVHDITTMFGSSISDYIGSLEVATAGAGVGYFRKLFPKPYYPYNAGSLLSVMPTEHKMIGFNAWDEEWELGTIDADGNNATSQTTIRSKNYIPVVAGAEYFFHNASYGTTSTMSARFYDADKNFIGTVNAAGNLIRWNTAARIPLNARYFRFVCTATYGTTYKNDICINISCERDGEYEPYKEWIYQIPGNTELRGLFKLDANNNLYVDGDIRTSNSITRKYGIVDLGTLSWNISSPSDHIFRVGFSEVPNIKAAATSQVLANAVCGRYTQMAYTPITANDNMCFAVSASGLDRVVFINHSYSTIESFKSAMSGVYLVYELATPTIESTESYINPQINDPYGTEEYVDERDVPIPVGHNTTYDSISMIGPNVINKTLILQYS